jgi:hypothetical protein
MAKPFLDGNLLVEDLYGPGHDDVELPATSVLEHGVEPGPLVPALGTADAGVLIDLDKLSATAVGNLPQLADLVLDSLSVC